ncbi:hypothetical protein KH388_23710 [Serratia rubidaea]|nr:hypothetical protein [Serratia rubidaea]
MLSSQVLDIVRLGGNVVITSESGLLSPQVLDVVRIANGNNAHVTIYAKRFLSSQLNDFVRIGGKNVTIVVD